MLQGSKIISDLLPDIPKLPGVYKMLGADAILYVGKAKNLYKRLIYYTKSDLSAKTVHLLSCVDKIDFIITQSEDEAILLEMNLIKKHQPKYNILLKDDKTFAYIKMDMMHQIPKIVKYRSKSKTEDKNLYGPFASNLGLKNMLSSVQKIFRLRNCSDYYFSTRKRACILYEIKRCSGPCVGHILAQDYQKDVLQAKMFLEGKTLYLQKILSEQMQVYSDNLEYEKAKLLRDKISDINLMQARSAMTNTNVTNFDVIGFAQMQNNSCIKLFTYKGGQNYGDRNYFYTEDIDKVSLVESFLTQFYMHRKLPEMILIPFALENVQSIQDTLSKMHNQKLQIRYDQNNNFLNNANENALICLQQRVVVHTSNINLFNQIAKLFDMQQISKIEVYDNSHIMGTYATGAMVAANINGFSKSDYRTYTIKGVVSKHGGDDYAMLKEVLTRRIKSMNHQNRPCLMIIDGGKGHLNAALEVMRNVSTPPKLVAMSKGKDRNAGQEVFHQADKASFTLDNTDMVMQYLQNLRDEVHNLAITTYRRKHVKSFYESSLDNIEGIGKHKKQILLNYFGSVKNIQNTNLTVLSKVPNIGLALAKKILSHLNNS